MHRLLLAIVRNVCNMEARVACDESVNGLKSMTQSFSIYYLHTAELINYTTNFILYFRFLRASLVAQFLWKVPQPFNTGLILI